jgi:DNA-binding response OmpR family regulator
MPDDLPRVLLAEASLPYRRVLREAIMAFHHCEVDDAPSGEAAFQMALTQRYALYIFAFGLPDMSGEMLDRLLAKAVPLVHQTPSAPPVIYLLRAEEADHWQSLQRNARVRGSCSVPPRLDKLMPTLSQLLPLRSTPALPL